jgi:hypothetical protein
VKLLAGTSWAAGETGAGGKASHRGHGGHRGGIGVGAKLLVGDVAACARETRAKEKHRTEVAEAAKGEWRVGGEAVSGDAAQVGRSSV